MLVREIFMCFEIICIVQWSSQPISLVMIAIKCLVHWMARKCTKRMISNHIKITLTSKAYYFMKPSYLSKIKTVNGKKIFRNYRPKKKSKICLKKTPDWQRPKKPWKKQPIKFSIRMILSRKIFHEFESHPVMFY